jgi:hypothetical protein
MLDVVGCVNNAPYTLGIETDIEPAIQQQVFQLQRQYSAKSTNREKAWQVEFLREKAISAKILNLN